jgi:hypothetical protein
MVTLAVRDEMIGIQNALLSGPGKLRNIFKKFDYAKENEKLVTIHKKMDQIADDLYELKYSINQDDSLANDAHLVLVGYLGALLETLCALERNTVGLANVAKSYQNKTYTLSDSQEDMKMVNESTQKYVRISSDLERLYQQL